MTLEISEGFEILLKPTEIAKVVLQRGHKMTAIRYVARKGSLATVAEEFGSHLQLKCRSLPVAVSSTFTQTIAVHQY